MRIDLGRIPNRSGAGKAEVEAHQQVLIEDCWAVLRSLGYWLRVAWGSGEALSACILAGTIARESRLSIRFSFLLRRSAPSSRCPPRKRAGGASQSSRLSPARSRSDLLRSEWLGESRGGRPCSKFPCRTYSCWSGS